MSRKMRKKELQKREKDKKIIFILENPGIDPGTSRMQSGRSTIWANPPLNRYSNENKAM